VHLADGRPRLGGCVVSQWCGRTSRCDGTASVAQSGLPQSILAANFQPTFVTLAPTATAKTTVPSVHVVMMRP
jgi:hypothetical protein